MWWIIEEINIYPFFLSDHKEITTFGSIIKYFCRQYEGTKGRSNSIYKIKFLCFFGLLWKKFIIGVTENLAIYLNKTN